MAATHEGDRQYWHSMSSGANRHETNSAVMAAVTLYVKELYEDSRKAQPVEHRWWYYGRILHAIEDSYSDAHVARVDNEKMSIRFFENYADQDGHKHSISDDSPGEDVQLIEEARADNDLDDKDIKLRQKLQRRKKSLWRRAEEMSIAFLRMVWDNVASKPGEAAPDKWKEIVELLENEIYVFDGAWFTAAAGGSLREYTKEGVKGRSRDKYDFGAHSAFFLQHNMKYMMQHVSAGMVRLGITHITGKDLHEADWIGQSDAFVVMQTGTMSTFQTQAAAPTALHRRSKEFDFEWNIHHFILLPESTVVYFKVYDSDTFIGIPKPEDSDHMGEGEITLMDFLPSVSRIVQDEEVTRKIKLTRKGKHAGYLTVTGVVSISSTIVVGPTVRAIA
jgi:hypothetical protein